jgi:hypothetical protein
MEKVIASRTFTKVLPDGRYVIANAKLTHLDGNTHPYFSLTGEEWQTLGHYNRRTHRETGLLCMGAMGDQLSEWFPQLAPLNALHLADDTGAPLHAIDNGWYWYEQSHDKGADYLRVTTDELPAEMDKEEFVAYVETLRWQWRYEANKAIAFLNNQVSAEAL